MSYFVDTTIIDEIVETAHVMDAKGVMNCFEGNISVKKDGLIYITPTGKPKYWLKPEFICVFDEEGNQIAGKFPVTSEFSMHKGVMEAREDINCVMHSHAPFATAFALMNKPVETNSYVEFILDHKIAEVASFGIPGSDDIWVQVPEILQKGYNTCLLANHGCLSVGEDINTAAGRMLSLENCCKILTICKMHGQDPVALPQEIVDACFAYGLPE